MAVIQQPSDPSSPYTSTSTSTTTSSTSSSSSGPPVPADSLPCSSPIFCSGPLLEAIQTAPLFNDSKTFVDMPLLASPQTILDAFELFGPNPNYGQLANLVQTYFGEAGSDLLDWTPTDWQPSPPFLSNIVDPKLRVWASDLNALWPTLGRMVDPNVATEPDRHSILHVDNGFVVPGGRFREWYYWDTFWIVRGLLVCELNDTVRGMLDNQLDVIDEFGFVPNGGRAYYLDRSQPPLLTQMVSEYYNTTNNITFLERAVPTLDAEYKFWMSKRAVTVTAPGGDGGSEGGGKMYTLNQYHSSVTTPRPESYLEDYTTARGLPPAQAEALFGEIASAAETGWDFSSRWMGNRQNLSSMATTTLVPVDLNSFMLVNERLMSSFHTILGNETAANMYNAAAEARCEAITAVLWNETAAIWRDYNMTTGAHDNTDFYVSTMLPLWAGCFDASNETVTTAILEAITGSGALDYLGGVPTSFVESGQQWDFPNAWPPLQYYTIKSLDALPQPAAGALAWNLIEEWVTSNYDAYNVSGAMFEKYNATAPGVPGGGGEYTVQKGFGWTNGVILDLLYDYGSVLNVTEVVERRKREAVNVGVGGRVSGGKEVLRDPRVRRRGV